MLAPLLRPSPTALRSSFSRRAPALSALTAASRAFSSSRTALAPNTLLFIEHRKGQINPATLSALSATQKLGGNVTGVVVGDDGQKGIVEAAKKLPGLSKLLYSISPKYATLASEPLAPLFQSILSSSSTPYTHFVGAHTAVGKDVFPRVAALLDVAQISDIVGIDESGSEGDTFVRPIYAGNAIATVKSSDKIKVFTVRGTAFDKAATEGGSADAEEVKPVDADAPTEFVSESVTTSSRPDLATAPRVVSGGRALKSAENFDKYLYPLADAIGAAVGASRAAVDAGYADNSLQVGQTGKIVAPELYMAIGISGAIQHLAGMKDSKTIVAINKDADAPIFQVADIGLVADLYEAVPELTEKLKK